jgi:heme/copper-type cytochrome/quinol oxidase subunit 2
MVVPNPRLYAENAEAQRKEEVILLVLSFLTIHVVFLCVFLCVLCALCVGILLP